ncbi:cytochrome P450 [Nocardia higoensis]|uniref:cytochrome P450 n=1 Tax=Nocardia higoensis TaxID=228599 RepID=UPI0002F6BE5B|nr:cytochrome P450 [Nocardia higoensis]
MTETAPPAAPFETTFDHRTDDDMRADQFARWDELRDSCPVRVNRTAAPRPVWYLLDYDDVRAAFQDWQTFSSRSVEAFESAEMAAAKKPWIPVEVDPPLHAEYRTLVAPFFAPKVAQDMADDIRRQCGELIDAFAGQGHLDFVAGFAKDLPTRVFLTLMGMPLEDAPRLLAWVDTLMHTKAEDDPDYSIRYGVRAQIMGYLGEMLDSRRREPKDDLLTTLVSAPLPSGRTLTTDEALAMSFQLYMAGLDTVANALGYTFRHLATHPEHRAAVAAGTVSARDVTEEMLRSYSVVNTSRVVTTDVEIGGCPVKAGDRVVLATAAANRDPAEFEDAATVVFGRKPNRHIAFGAGKHRCLGSHLARVELEIVIEEWHKRIPDYRIPAGAVVEDHVGSVSGLVELPLEWTP